MKKSKKLSTSLNLNLLYTPQPILTSKNNFVKNIQNNIITNVNTKKMSNIQYNIELSNASNLNICFIPNNIKNNVNCNWNQNTHISKERLVYDKSNNLESYIFKLENDSKNTGYVIISGTSLSNLTPKFIYKLILSLFN